MSVLWFIFLAYARCQGVEIDNITFLMIAIFYVGDCILIHNRRTNDGKND